MHSDPLQGFQVLLNHAWEQACLYIGFIFEASFCTSGDSWVREVSCEEEMIEDCFKYLSGTVCLVKSIIMNGP